MLGVKDFHILASKNGEEVLELLFITTSSLTPQKGNYGWSWLESLYMIKNLSLLFWVGVSACFCYVERRFSYLSLDVCFPLDPKNAQFRLLIYILQAYEQYDVSLISLLFVLWTINSGV